jgi:hypothetical protein
MSFRNLFFSEIGKCEKNNFSIMRCPYTVVCVLRVNFFYFHKKEINACRMHASYWAFIRTLASPSLLGIQFLK